MKKNLIKIGITSIIFLVVSNAVAVPVMSSESIMNKTNYYERVKEISGNFKSNIKLLGGLGEIIEKIIAFFRAIFEILHIMYKTYDGIMFARFILRIVVALYLIFFGWLWPGLAWGYMMALIAYADPLRIPFTPIVAFFGGILGGWLVCIVYGFGLLTFQIALNTLFNKLLDD